MSMFNVVCVADAGRPFEDRQEKSFYYLGDAVDYYDTFTDYGLALFERAVSIELNGEVLGSKSFVAPGERA